MVGKGGKFPSSTECLVFLYYLLSFLEKQVKAGSLNLKNIDIAIRGSDMKNPGKPVLGAAALRTARTGALF